MIDIRTVRQQLKLSQTEFGQRLGLHQTTISRLETGELEVDRRTELAVRALQSEGALVCGVCDRRADNPTTRDCVASNCGLRAKEAA